MLEKTLENLLDYKGIQPVHPKGSQSWIFIGRTDVEAEALVLWSPDVKSWLIRKDSDTGKGWRQEEKGTRENEMVGCHHRLNGQGSLACCSLWDHKELDTEQLNWTDNPAIALQDSFKFLAVLGPPCCVQAASSCAGVGRGLLLDAVSRLLVAASLVVEYWL